MLRLCIYSWVIVTSLCQIDMLSAADAVLPSAITPFLPTPLFENFTTDQGLPSSTVIDLAEDHDGVLWMATRDGLAYYDGIDIVVFRHHPEQTTSIPGNDVQTVFVDDDNQIWVGVQDGGLARLNKAHKTFQRWQSTSLEHGFQGRDVWAIAQTRDHAIWAGTYAQGLNHIDLQTREVQNFQIINNQKGLTDTVLTSNDIITLMSDVQGQLWIGTSNGLTLFQQPEELTHLMPRHWLSGHVISALMQDAEGIVWIGTTQGLFRFNPQDDDEPRFYSDVENTIIRATLFDQQKNLWYGISQGLVYRDSQQQMIQFSDKDMRRYAFPAGIVSDILQDHEQGLWFATSISGLVHINPNWKNFQIYRSPWSSDEPSYSNIIATCPEQVILGHDQNKALLFMDLQHNTRYYQLLSMGVNFRQVSSLACTKDFYWIGHRHGLQRINRQTLQTKTVLDNRVGNIDLLYVDTHHNLWASERGVGLHHIDQAGKTVLYQQSVSREIEHIQEDFKQRVWVGGTEGMARFDAEKQTWISFSNPTLERVDAFTFSSDDTLWMHTMAGLYHYQIESTALKLIDKLDATQGLPIAEMGGIWEDVNQHIWMSGPRGLFQIQTHPNKIRQYQYADGLLTHDFPLFMPQVLKDNTVIINTRLGLMRFLPSVMRDHHLVPSVSLHELSIQKNAKKVLLNTHEKIQLDYDDHNLHIAVRASSLSDPASNRYRFWLSPFENDWVETGSHAERNFSWVPDGQFVLRAAAATAHGAWQELPTAIHIHVAPPMWRSRWAYLSYLIVFLLGIIAFWQVLRVRTRRKHALLLIENARHIAEQKHQAKSDFLADMGHEIRTPMSGLIGMADLLLRTTLNTTQQQYAHILKRSGSHLMDLINNLLDLSKLEAKKLTLDLDLCDLHSLLEEVVQIEKAYAKERDLNLQLNIDAQVPCYVRADSMRLKQILLNLINNALKFTEHGYVYLNVKMMTAVEIVEGDEQQVISFQVCDSGLGMSNFSLETLMNRFTQLQPARSAGGSGLGLSIVYQLVHLMDGCMDVKSIMQKGSTFTVNIPFTIETSASSEKAHRISISSEYNIHSTECPQSILVIEDHPDLRMVLTHTLQDMGHQVIAVAHGLEALQNMTTEIFDLVLVDIDLPGINGLQLLPLLKKAHRQEEKPLYTVAITANSTVKIVQEVYDAGFDGFFRKPVTREQLIFTCQQASVVTAK